ncbi:MAG TPA: lysoplasmalogenase family protein, partial [Ferruginibacter sp.]|nr:lysoplasmalogenase family protein [Ferruginibacter sp.]
MLQPVQNKIIIAFWVLAFLDLLGIAAGIEILHFTVKPLLIPVLILLLLKTRSTVPGKNLLMTVLFFSWMGDVFLLFENKQPLFFIFGLASFLITHIFYIIYFLR